MKTLSVEMLDSLRATVVNEMLDARRLQGASYADVRVELWEQVGASAEDGLPRSAGKDFGFSLGVRMIAGDSLQAAGYEGEVLGVKDFFNFKEVLHRAVLTAWARARENARMKALYKNAWERAGNSLVGTQLAAIPVTEQVIQGKWAVDPRSVEPSRLLEYLVHISGNVKAQYPKVMRVGVGAELSLERKLFASSEGTLIDQIYACAAGTPFILAQSDANDPVDLSHTCGNQVGAEALFERVNTFGVDYETFVLGIAKEAVDLAGAPPLRTSEHPVTVVTDPDFNALVAHEILAHPSELDRAMKWETGYAGRSWFFRTPQDTVRDEQIGSPLLTVFSDPKVTGAYGHYLFDDEGTPARRVYHLVNGVYQEFLTSRDTAAKLGVEPNGHYLANDASVVPVIRMSVSAFAPGESDPLSIVKDVEHGYYIAGHRMPAIAESRENFRIAGRLVYEIKNGELGQLFRDGGIMSDSRDFFMSIDAVGNDFKIFPIPNCGKGQPMQAKRVGNGGPTMRGRAYLAGGK